VRSSERAGWGARTATPQPEGDGHAYSTFVNIGLVLSGLAAGQVWAAEDEAAETVKRLPQSKRILMEAIRQRRRRAELRSRPSSSSSTARSGSVCTPRRRQGAGHGTQSRHFRSQIAEAVQFKPDRESWLEEHASDPAAAAVTTSSSHRARIEGVFEYIMFLLLAPSCGAAACRLAQRADSTMGWLTTSHVWGLPDPQNAQASSTA
jgi:hypothetical protein